MIGHLSGEPDPRPQAPAESSGSGPGALASGQRRSGSWSVHRASRPPWMRGSARSRYRSRCRRAIMRIAAPISAARPRRRPSGEISAATARNVLTGWRNQPCPRSPPSSSRSPASARYSSRLAHAATRHRPPPGRSGRTGLSWPGPCVTSRRRAVSARIPGHRHRPVFGPLHRDGTGSGGGGACRPSWCGGPGPVSGRVVWFRPAGGLCPSW